MALVFYSISAPYKNAVEHVRYRQVMKRNMKKRHGRRVVGAHTRERYLSGKCVFFRQRMVVETDQSTNVDRLFTLLSMWFGVLRNIDEGLHIFVESFGVWYICGICFGAHN